MDKAKIRAELDKLGVVYNARLGEDKLMAILEDARKKNATVAPPAEAPAPVVPAAGPETAQVAPAEAQAPAPTAPSGVVKIIDRFGMVCRTYSLAQHGEEYVELAQSFAKKKGLRIA